MKSFDHVEAARYDVQMPARVPGYLELLPMARAILELHVGEEAHVLVVGAGTGNELVAMAIANPSWHLLALDPSREMLDVARAKAASECLLDRIEFVEGPMEALHSDRVWHGAVSILVSQFLPDDGAKERFYRAVATHLAPGAPLVLAELMGWGPTDGQSLRAAWLRWAQAREGVSGDAERMMARVQTSFHPVAESRLEELLSSAGFTAPVRFAQALEFGAYLSFRAAR